MSNDLTLRPQDVHIWLCRDPEISDHVLLQHYTQLLSPEEHDRQQRFHFARHRHQYLVTRALLRTTLSRYTNIAPQQWQFASNDYGRPYLVNDLGQDLDLRFNLSHTDGLIACAVVRDREVGVDVEILDRDNRIIDIANRFFSQRECAELHLVPEEQQKQRFFDYWTLKESYIKARGMGLSIPLGQFSFLFSTDNQIKVAIDTSLQDRSERWQFIMLNPDDEHKLSLCTEKAVIEDQLMLHDVIPLATETRLDVNALRYLPSRLTRHERTE